MSRTVIAGEDARNKVFEGITYLYNAVSSTLGPHGSNVIIEEPYCNPLITKDGVTVARKINFKDPYLDLGVQIMKQVACKTDQVVGDGTTTSTVLAYHLYNACVTYLKDHEENKLKLLNVLNEAEAFILDYLTKRTHKINTDDELYNIALISCNSDKDIAKLVFDAFKSAGPTLNIQVDINTKPEDEIRVYDGMRLFTGFCTPHFVNKKSTSECILNNLKIFITEDNLLNYKDAEKILNNAIHVKSPVLVFCPVCAGEALQTFVVNKERGVCECCVVTYPQYGVSRSELIEDLVSITGAKPISLAQGKSIAASTPDDFGVLSKCIVTINNTYLTRDPSVNSDKLTQIIADIKDKLSTCSIADAPKYSMRLNRLCGTIVELMVGGMTEVEVKERKDRVVDAVGAVRAAVEDGYIAGSGKELFNVSMRDEFKNILGEIDIAHVFSKPLELILNSSFIEYGDEILEPESGYNAYTHEFGNLIKMGIVDPTKVTKTAVKNAFSVVKILLNTNVVVINDR